MPVALCNRATTHLKFQSSCKTQHRHRRVWMGLFSYLLCKCPLAQQYVIRCYPQTVGFYPVLGLGPWWWKMHTKYSQRNLSRQTATPCETTYCRNERRNSIGIKKSTPGEIPAFGNCSGRSSPANPNLRVAHLPSSCVCVREKSARQWVRELKKEIMCSPFGPRKHSNSALPLATDMNPRRGMKALQRKVGKQGKHQSGRERIGYQKGTDCLDWAV